MFREKRGQAAMEFLMTYGWAILAAIIAIGALSYFTIGGTSQNVASLNAPFYLEAWNAGASATNGTIGLGVKNNGDGTITPVSITVVDAENSVNCAVAAPAAISSGDIADVSAVCDSALVAGDKFNGDITIKYTRTGTTQLTSTGSIKTTVVA